MKIGVDTTFLVELTIREHPGYDMAKKQMDKILRSGDVFVVAPQVLTEFLHVVTDSRRFEKPLNMIDAQEKAKIWWESKEVEQVTITSDTMILFMDWMKVFKLGRKRILDTMLAATYYSHQVHAIITTNARDYAVFDCFKVIVP